MDLNWWSSIRLQKMCKGKAGMYGDPRIHLEAGIGNETLICFGMISERDKNRNIYCHFGKFF